jgi:antitoxin component YwqK of YwqJK toxin-antitoxin module
MPDQDSGYQT